MLEQDRLRGLRPMQRVHVAKAAAAFLEVRFEHERDLAGLRVPCGRRARSSSSSHRFERRSHCVRGRSSQVHRERRVARDVSRARAVRWRCRDRSRRSRAPRAACTRCGRASGPRPRSDTRSVRRARARPARAAEQHQVEVALRAELGAAVATDRHQRAPTVSERRSEPTAPARSGSSHSSTRALWRAHQLAPVSVLSASSGPRSSCTFSTVRDAAGSLRRQIHVSRVSRGSQLAYKRETERPYVADMFTSTQATQRTRTTAIHRGDPCRQDGGGRRDHSVPCRHRTGISLAAGAATAIIQHHRQRLRQPDQHDVDAGHGVPRVLHAGGLHGPRGRVRPVAGDGERAAGGRGRHLPVRRSSSGRSASRSSSGTATASSGTSTSSCTA